MGGKRVLPRINEDINEEWLSDKSRYSCDGLAKQRLDVPYIKKQNKLVKSSWDEAIDIIAKKIIDTPKDQIAGHVGDMTSLETMFAFKKFLNSNNILNLDFREKKSK